MLNVYPFSVLKVVFSKAELPAHSGRKRPQKFIKMAEKWTYLGGNEDKLFEYRRLKVFA
jgi:hypothetical protein